MKFFKNNIFLFLILGIIFLFPINNSFAQSIEIEEINSPTSKNLTSAYINGDNIYVFGDDCFAAKSANNGVSWEIFNINNCEGSIKSAYVFPSSEDVIIIGDSFIRRKNTPYVSWGNFSNFTEDGGFSSILSDRNGNVYLFPKNNQGNGTKFLISNNNPNSFYLPARKSSPRISDFTYRANSLSGNTLVTFLHNLNNGGIFSSVYTSSDNGKSWKAGKVETDPSKLMTYAVTSSFNNNNGFMVGVHYGGYGVFLYKTSDNGNNWSFISSKNDNLNPKSIHTIDSDSFVVVGSKLVSNKWNKGFIMDKNGEVIDFSSPLNYISSSNNHSNKMIAVGDNGKIIKINFNNQTEETVSINTSFFINNFINNGVDNNTIRLGKGERMAVISSYQLAFGKMPESDMEINDVIKIANGRWPSITNLNAENKAKNEFKNIYKRAANMNNANDNAAITIMAYGLRQRAENRNLNSESAGLKTFRAIYNRLPQNTNDWNILQAITYSGATR
ncbi:MAG TPA: hypothetical protein PK142_02865 [bacterium]|nr:hypothetical protein [bacterium]